MRHVSWTIRQMREVPQQTVFTQTVQFRFKSKLRSPLPTMRQQIWLLLLKVSIILASLLLITIFSQSRTDLDPSYILSHSGLEYTDDDDRPEKVCDCPGIVRGELEAVDHAKILSLTKDFRKSVQIPDDYYINATQDCRKFKMQRKYFQLPLSQEEEDFPLAYSMVVHHKVQNFERLLRAIYAPQNIYCVHVDTKSESSVISAIQGIVSCFPNVFIASKAESVVYSDWSRVQADLNCMADLYNSSVKWKYFINVCGQDFPLKTNLEIVRAVQSLNGGNSLESEEMANGKKWRVLLVHEIVDGKVQRTQARKEPAPFDVPILSGSAYIVANRDYVRSVLEDKRILALIEWSKDAYSPDEFLWATIQRLPGVAGSKWPNPKYDMSDINAIARLVKWQWHEGSQDSPKAAYPKCQGTHVRAICVYGVGDLKWMLEQHHLFANKFDVATNPNVIYCLEKYLREKALAQIR